MRMRLLLVEDDPKLAAAVTRGLRVDGYAVDHVRDGDAALVHASVYDYDGIVLDVMLPARDWLDVCRTLRDHVWDENFEGWGVGRRVQARA
jgi:DNA-binding response OmpR family regulator